jgi:acetate---CoA ligase (ADP-forming)
MHGDVGPAALQPLLQPRSIVVVGASATPGKAGNALVGSLASFAGPVYLVNPNASEIAGRPCAATVGEIPDTADLAVLTVPAEAVPAALDDCGRAGIRAAVICAGGFAESAAGVALQDQVVEIARRYSVRVLGPNTSGFVSPVDGIFATFVRSAASLRPGSVSIVARSGGANLAGCFLASNAGTGIRFGVGVGNGADVGFPEVLDFLAHDDKTTAVGLHLEGITDGRLLCDAIRRLVSRKPVVALKVGQAPVDDFAQSHTGALLGDYELAVAALTQSGAVVVEDLGELVDALEALRACRARPKADPGVAIVTAQAGPGLIAADALTAAGVAVPELSEPTVTAIGTLLPPLTWIRNPVDTGRPSTTFPELLGHVARDPGVDIIAVYALDEPDALQPTNALEKSAVLTMSPRVPVLFGIGGPADAIAESHSALAELGVPAFSEPRRLARAARALAMDGQARWRLSVGTTPSEHTADPAVMRTLDEHQAKQVLEAMGVPTTRRRLCRTKAEARQALGEFGTPVVAKIASTEIRHKSDVGGVRANIFTEDQLTAALAAIDAIQVSEPAEYLIEAQAGAGPELLVGGIRDPSFGPAVVLSLGGVDVELIGRPIMRLAPVSLADVDGMADSLPRVLRDGHRGAAPLDRDGLARIILAVSRILITSPTVTNIDLNPVRLTANGLVVLDALIVCG